jgi:hypothetical protein
LHIQQNLAHFINRNGWIVGKAFAAKHQQKQGNKRKQFIFQE